MEGVRITRLRVTNYRGVEALDLAVPPHGAVMKGPNATGKTSVLKAIRSALASQDIGEDAIRLGTDRAEILIDLSCASVRRVIGHGDTTIEVRDPDGRQIKSPKKWLTDILGSAALDPIEFYKKKSAERVQLLLAAIPIPLPVEQARAAIDQAGADLDVGVRDEMRAIIAQGGHALTACAAIAKLAASERTVINRGLKDAERDAEAALAAGGMPAPDAAEKAALEMEEARKALEAIEGRQRRATETAATRERIMSRIAELRAQAKTAAETPQPALPSATIEPQPDDSAPESAQAPAVTPREAASRTHAAALEKVAEGEKALDSIRATIEKLKTQLAREEENLGRAKIFYAEGIAARNGAQRTLEELDRQDRAVLEAHARTIAEAPRLLQQADELQATIAAVEAPPRPQEIEEAQARHRAKILEHGTAVAGAKRRAAFEAAQNAGRELARKAAALGAIVTAFKETLPQRLIAGGAGIEGLSIDGDRILFDTGGGPVEIDSCSGAEQLKFAVEIAKRSNPRTKILVVDELETLDPAAHEVFVKHAVAGGWQLIGARVDAGDNVFEAIEAADGGAS